LARWQDLLPYQDERVRSGIVIIRSRLKGEEAQAQTLFETPSSSLASSPTSPPRSSSKPELEPIPLSFEVAGLSDLLVRVGQEVEEGELLARRSSLPLKRQSFALQAARARYRAGLLEEAEILALEREFQEMEVEYEVRAPLKGTITKIELKGFKEAGLEVVLHLRPDPSLADRLGLAPASSLEGSSAAEPFPGASSATTTSTTCPPPLAVCDQAQVLAVVDGDTIDLLLGGRQERVRLIGVDTPETKHPDKPVECFGPEASAFTAQTLDQHQVWLTYKPDERYDKYGRLLAYLWLDLDGDPEVELFNQELVARGYARVYPFFPFEYLDQFRQAEAQAQSQGLGLWGECGYQPYAQ
jgi:micrococcal nuclease